MKKSNIREFAQTLEEAKNPPEMVEFVWNGEDQTHWRAGRLQKRAKYRAREDDLDGLIRDYPKAVQNVTKDSQAPEDKMMKGSPERK